MGEMADYDLDQIMDLDEIYLNDPYGLDDEGNENHDPFLGWNPGIFRRSFVPIRGLKASGPGLCPLCKNKTIKKSGKFGEFYGCVNFPDCKGSRNL